MTVHEDMRMAIFTARANEVANPRGLRKIAVNEGLRNKKIIDKMRWVLIGGIISLH